MKLSKALATMGVGAALAVTVANAPAEAASWHGISGTTYSGCPSAGQPTWYISSNARFKEGTGAVKAQFSSIGPNDLGFKIVNSSYATIGTVKYWTEHETDITRTLASSVSNGTRFYNAFRETGTSCLVRDHEFTGSEYY